MSIRNTARNKKTKKSTAALKTTGTLRQKVGRKIRKASGWFTTARRAALRKAQRVSAMVRKGAGTILKKTTSAEFRAKRAARKELKQSDKIMLRRDLEGVQNLRKAIKASRPNSKKITLREKIKDKAESFGVVVRNYKLRGQYALSRGKRAKSKAKRNRLRRGK